MTGGEGAEKVYVKNREQEEEKEDELEPPPEAAELVGEAYKGVPPEKGNPVKEYKDFKQKIEEKHELREPEKEKREAEEEKTEGS